MDQKQLRTYVTGELARGLHDSAMRFMAPSDYRDFFVWALSTQNPEQETWLGLLGVPQLAKVVMGMLHGIVSVQQVLEHFEYIRVISSYLTFEVFSDNLGIGLMSDDSRLTRERRQLMLHFNDAMIARLAGDPKPLQHYLNGTAHLLDNVSVFDQSLSVDKHRRVSEAFLATYPDHDPSVIEFGMLPLLALNIEMAAATAQKMSDTQSHTLIRTGLQQRYASVSALASNPQMPLEDQLEHTTYAILAMPVLNYFCSLVGEIIHQHQGYVEAVQTHVVRDAIYVAAQQVRLLNDLGMLVVQSVEARQQTMQSLADLQSWQQHATLGELIADPRNVTSVLTRLQKDACHGESNLCLNELRHAVPNHEVLKQMEARLATFARIYQENSLTLKAYLAELDGLCGDLGVSQIISRFVDFHVQLYSQEFDKVGGEYAV